MVSHCAARSKGPGVGNLCDKVRYLPAIPCLAREGPRQTDSGLLRGARRHCRYRTLNALTIR